MSRLKILSNLKREEGTWLDYVALRGHTIITLAHKGTLPVKMFGPFWSVWCKIALAEAVDSLKRTVGPNRFSVGPSILFVSTLMC